MSNCVIIIGRLADEIKEGKIKLAVNRPFENKEGIYETDFIPIVLWGGTYESTKEYIHKGDLVGIKGRLETKDEKVYVIAEKLTFLSSKK